MASFTCQSRDALMGRTLTLLRRSLGLVLGFGGPRLRRQDGVDWLRGLRLPARSNRQAPRPPRTYAVMSTAAFEPAYVRLLRSGELADRARRSRRQMENCDLCARYCRVNRLRSIRGAVCRTGERAVVYSAGPHHGEEDCLRGWRGSGTIFFFAVQPALRLLPELGDFLARRGPRGER